MAPPLPVVSMEDVELFPLSSPSSRVPSAIRPTRLATPLDVKACRALLAAGEPLWWSRLIISIRGFVVNFDNFAADDARLFSTDDAFISLHRAFVEDGSTVAGAMADNLAVFTSVEGLGDLLEALDAGKAVPEKDNPFLASSTAPAFEALFGTPNAATYRVANLQKEAYYTFTRILSTLLKRWATAVTPKKGIRFDKDPEWQPDNRVVLFQEFYSGNRTWVLTDFDRHILAHWRPKGTHVIFGDRQIEKKQRAGFNLCDHCGMLEQFPGQFALMDKFRLCSSECLESLIEEANALPAAASNTVNIKIR